MPGMGKRTEIRIEREISVAGGKKEEFKEVEQILDGIEQLKEHYPKNYFRIVLKIR